MPVPSYPTKSELIAYGDLSTFNGGYWLPGSGMGNGVPIAGAVAFDGGAYSFAPPAASIIDVSLWDSIKIMLVHKAGALTTPTSALYVGQIDAAGNDAGSAAGANLARYQAAIATFSANPGLNVVELGRGVPVESLVATNYAYRSSPALLHRIAIFHTPGGSISGYAGRLELWGTPRRTF